MNKRIQELAEQAEEYADSMVDEGSDFHPEYTQKFAELIIEEYRTKMIETVQNRKDAPWAGNAYPAEPMVVSLSEAVEKHFGVTE